MSNCFTQACAAALLAFSLMAGSAQMAQAEGVKPAVSASGVIAARSAYGMEETVARLKKDVAAKGITFFQEIDLPYNLKINGALHIAKGVHIFYFDFFAVFLRSFYPH